jgi:NitT/TauT family transport system ATP-binding protein
MAADVIRIQVQEACHARNVGDGVRIFVGPVSLEIRAGEFVAIVAPPASGKTSLLRMIAGTLPVTSGEIRITGARIRPPEGDCGLVLQHPALLGWRTVMQNILLQAQLRGLDLVESQSHARRMLAWLGLSEYEEGWPEDLPPGFAPLVSVCRALVHRPSLLLLDEPFRLLDPLVQERILDGFQRLWLETKTTTVLCTGNIQEGVLLADRVAVMSRHPGKILQEFPIDLPRPRRMDRTMSPRIAEFCSRIRTLFQAQGVLP